MRTPDGFAQVRGVGALGFARPTVVAHVHDMLVRWGSLARAAARDPERLVLVGRGPVHAVPAPEGGRWVVRRYRRGGWVAPLLGERYLRRGPPRPLIETLASEAARARGVATPRVVAGMVYRSGPFYRADLVTEWIPDSVDLATLLFGRAPDFDHRETAPASDLLAAAGRLIHDIARAGIVHRDLNAKNLLVRSAEAGPHLLVLDFDRAKVHDARPVDATGMTRRLVRSLRKFERRSGHPLPLSAWQALDQATAAAGSTS